MSAWTYIAHTEIGSGGAANIQFTSIPTGYTDLVLVVSGRSTRTSIVSDNIAIRLNDSTSGYTWIRFFGTGSVSQTDRSSGTNQGLVEALTATDATSNTFGSSFIYIPNYRSSVAKSLSSDGVTENNAVGAYTSMSGVTWTGTDAITKITIFPWASNNFTQYTSATLYGITRGSSGGVVVS